MRFTTSLLAAAAAFAVAAPAISQVPPKPGTAEAKDVEKADPDVAKASATEQAFPKQRSIPFRGTTLAYTVTPGTLTIRDDDGAPIASMFYTAYTIPSKGKPRPVTFMYNGGPGSSTMWLHMGSWGPMKVDVPGLQGLRGDPTRLIPNQDTILDKTDIVFLDAIGTGLSRPLGKSDGKQFWGVDGDLDAFARGIQRYITKYERWDAPKFLLGESYGTLRSAGLVNTLQERGVKMAGVTLVSTVLNVGLLFDPSMDQAHINLLPTLAATAWYHNRLQNRPADLDAFAVQAKAFANGPYTLALAKGDNITPEEQAAVAQQAATFLGVSPEFLIRSNLRPGPDRFRKELLRDQRRTVGRLDSRFDGIDVDAGADSPEFDPANEAIAGAFIAALNNYLFKDLGYPTTLNYRPNYYSAIGPAWVWNHRTPGGGRQFAGNTTVDLSQAMRTNRQLKVLQLNGYYDIATPFAGADYDLEHMGLDATLKKNVTYKYYPSGHMIYIEPGSSKRLKADLDAFYDSVLR